MLKSQKELKQEPLNQELTNSSSQTLIIIGLVSVISIAGVYIFRTMKTTLKQQQIQSQKAPQKYM